MISLSRISPENLALACFLLTPACARHYPARGWCQREPVRPHVNVSHRDIPALHACHVDVLPRPKTGRTHGPLSGAQIEFDLGLQVRSHIERLRRVGASAVIEDQGDRIALPPNPDRIEMGEAMRLHPDRSAGNAVRLSDPEQGGCRHFIYHTWPSCPTSARGSRRPSPAWQISPSVKEMPRDLVLLSITSIALHDTADVLLKYAKIWNARLDRMAISHRTGWGDAKS